LSPFFLGVRKHFQNDLISFFFFSARLRQAFALHFLSPCCAALLGVLFRATHLIPFFAALFFLFFALRTRVNLLSAFFYPLFFRSRNARKTSSRFAEAPLSPLARKSFPPFPFSSIGRFCDERNCPVKSPPPLYGAAGIRAHFFPIVWRYPRHPAEFLNIFFSLSPLPLEK